MTLKIWALEKKGGGSLLYQKLHVEQQTKANQKTDKSVLHPVLIATYLEQGHGSLRGTNLGSKLLHSKPSPSYRAGA